MDLSNNPTTPTPTWKGGPILFQLQALGLVLASIIRKSSRGPWECYINHPHHLLPCGETDDLYTAKSLVSVALLAKQEVYSIPNQGKDKGGASQPASNLPL